MSQSQIRTTSSFYLIGKYVVTNIFYALASLFCILLIINLPILLFSERHLTFQFGLYVERIVSVFRDLGHLGDITYMSESGKEYAAMPQIWESYTYSFSLIASAFILACVVAFIFVFIYQISLPPVKRILKEIILIVEAIPDVMAIVLMQMFFIAFYKIFNWMPFAFYELSGQKPYILPILCLSVLPIIQISRFLMIYMEEEEGKPYVLLLTGKGLGKKYIVVVHLFRNVMLSFINYSKVTFLMMISNLFIIEFMFNTDGIINFLLYYGIVSPVLSFVIMSLMFLTYFILISILKIVTFKYGGEFDA